MDRILEKARGGRSALERMASAIPGFKGYRERELRRDADRLQREHLAARLEANKKALDDLANRASRAGALDALNEVETARKRLDKLVAGLRYASRGYSGFFDAVKVDEAALERIYEFDLGLLEGVEAVRAAAAGTGRSVEGADQADTLRVTAMIAALDALGERLAEREAVLGGFR
jgi:hypothetical protein